MERLVILHWWWEVLVEDRLGSGKEEETPLPLPNTCLQSSPLLTIPSSLLIPYQQTLQRRLHSHSNFIICIFYFYY